MSANPELEATRREWAAAALDHLAAVTEAVDALRTAFDTLGDEQTPPSDDADGVVEACIGLATWLDAFKAPRGLGKAGGELGAAAGVFRNAAFTYRSLGDADDEARLARLTACAMMLEQGDGHVDAFRALVAKKVGRNPS